MSSSLHRLVDADPAPPAKRLKSSAAEDSASTKESGRVEKFVRREESVGITEYLVPDAVGFQGLLKQRYTDFLVNEIDKDGNVLKLKSLHLEKKKKQAKITDDLAQSDIPIADVTESNGNGSTKITKIPSEQVQQQEKSTASVSGDLKVNEENAIVEEPKSFELEDADRALLISWLGSEITCSLIKLYNDIMTIEREVKPNYKIVTPETKLLSPKPIDDKDARSQLHRAIRRIFFGKIQSATDDEYNIEFWATKISGAKPPSHEGKKDGRRPLESWDSLGGEFLHFNLYKENKDTMECLTLLGKFLKLAPKTFAIAGTKDRRAVTVQRVSARKLKAERLEATNKKLKGLKVGDFEYKSYPLDLGDLNGNEFKISLRDCAFPEGADVDQIVANGVSILREKGFINYYGMQRFGTFAVSTHEIGKSMLLGDWKRAVYQIMAYDDETIETAPRDEKQRAEACKLWFGDPDSPERAAAALKLMPPKFASENAILKWFSRPVESGKHLGALQKIPRNLRLMFVHAYQSYIWNTIASERLKRYGTSMTPGDLVVISAEDVAADKPTLDPDEEDMVDEADEEQSVCARPVTEEEIASGKYNIYDVVLPSPGWDIVYPENDLRGLYVDIMGKDGLDPFNMVRNQKEVSMSGHYRRLLYRPEKVEWEVKRYDGFLDQLVETDLMYVQRQREKGKGGAILSKDEGLVQEAVENPAGSRIAVIISLTLGTSQYATMALRELSKGGITSFAVTAPVPPDNTTGPADVKMENC
ncbi:hypothetical protein H072_2783 [Dactylellina haptotyla CBS 200.50]|uniref:TRUD domain-containing protein n=1 Tax=Dactylellina haptotyla (strain CBS 200.50) TaxID=1284197 RepID=S8AQD3_DACHA|nr:hypothetical protein H072_2783 [Dactylellina haptotyla CBS 200.50]